MKLPRRALSLSTSVYKEGMDQWLFAVTSDPAVKGSAKDLKVTSAGPLHCHFFLPPNFEFRTMCSSEHCLSVILNCIHLIYHTPGIMIICAGRLQEVTTKECHLMVYFDRLCMMVGLGEYASGI